MKTALLAIAIIAFALLAAVCGMIAVNLAIRGGDFMHGYLTVTVASVGLVSAFVVAEAVESLARRTFAR